MSSPLNAIRVAHETLRTAAFGAIGAGYGLVGGLFANNIRILTIENRTNAALLFSLDGVNDWINLNAGSTYVLDLTANRTDMGGALVISANTGVWVKQSGVPASGAVYVSVIYGQY